eukprot:21216-Chlamydomonas_euryale.AAC.5
MALLIAGATIVVRSFQKCMTSSQAVLLTPVKKNAVVASGIARIAPGQQHASQHVPMLSCQGSEGIFGLRCWAFACASTA